MIRKIFSSVLLLLFCLLLFSPTSIVQANMTAKSASDFTDSIGVNTHLFYSDTVYDRFAAVKAKLRKLGVKHIRDHLVEERPDLYSRINNLASDGIKTTLFINDLSSRLTTPDRFLKLLNDKVLSAVVAIEGPNEYDLSDEPDWLNELIDYQQRLYQLAQENSKLRKIPIISPSLAGSKSDIWSVNFKHIADYGNIHSYPDAEPPENNIIGFRQAMIEAINKPLIATETGYHNALRWPLEHPNNHYPVTEKVEAIYLPRLFLEYFRLGIKRTFSYELIDHFPNPRLDEREYHFGLLRNDFSEKPSFRALKNLLTILQDEHQQIGQNNLDIKIKADDDIHHLLLRKSDGNYYLALWQAKSIWNKYRQQEIQVQPAKVNLTIGNSAAVIDTYRPNISSKSLKQDTIQGNHQLSIGPEVTIVKLTQFSPLTNNRISNKNQSKKLRLKACFAIRKNSLPLVVVHGFTNAPSRVWLKFYHHRRWRWLQIVKPEQGTFFIRKRLPVKRYRVSLHSTAGFGNGQQLQKTQRMPRCATLRRTNNQRRE